MWAQAFGRSVLLPACPRLLLAWSSKNTAGSDGSICAGGSALPVRGSVPSSLASHRAVAFSAVVPALCKHNLPSNEFGSSLKPASSLSVVEDV